MRHNDARLFLRKRYYIIILIMVGWMVMTMLRTNLSICLVDMTSNKTLINGNKIEIREAEFQWEPIQQGMVLSSFSWGFLLSPVGGLLAIKFGGVNTYGFGILCTGLLTVLSPILIRLHFYIYLVGRILEGVFEGISIAASGTIFTQWAPPHERTFLTNLCHSGYSVGLIVSYPLAGHLIQILNWEYAFFITGGISILWCVLWFIIAREYPENDDLMTKTEKKYLRTVNTVVPKEKIRYSWKKMLTSKVLWAMLNERFVESWSNSFFAYCMPLYIKDVYNVSIEEIGWLSSIPFYFELFSRIPAACLADYLRAKKLISKTMVHKTFILCAQIGAMIFLIIAAIGRQFFVSFTAVLLFKLSYSVSLVSYSVLPLDIGGPCASLMFGLCTMAMSIGFILNPLVISFMITDHNVGDWSKYFFFLCGFNAWAAIIFGFFGSGELQPWTYSIENESVEDKTNNS